MCQYVDGNVIDLRIIFFQWYESDDLYGGKESHLQFTGRHRLPPRAPTPPKVWDIDFSDDEDQCEERCVAVAMMNWTRIRIANFLLI